MTENNSGAKRCSVVPFHQSKMISSGETGVQSAVCRSEAKRGSSPSGLNRWPFRNRMAMLSRNPQEGPVSDCDFNRIAKRERERSFPAVVHLLVYEAPEWNRSTWEKACLMSKVGRLSPIVDVGRSRDVLTFRHLCLEFLTPLLHAVRCCRRFRSQEGRELGRFSRHCWIVLHSSMADQKRQKKDRKDIPRLPVLQQKSPDLILMMAASACSQQQQQQTSKE